MKINAINNNRMVGFKSLREDKHRIEQLKTETKPIIGNNKINIYQALNNISENPERSDIEFLLDVAKNIKYGQGKNSEFKGILDSDGITPEERENTKWDELLQNTINKALKSAKDDVNDLKEVSKDLFNTTKPLTEEQKRILELRKTITDMIIDEDTLEDSENLTLVSNIRKNLDYFIASSEISYPQKEYCLERFQYLLSDDYKINPQLSDKKLNVLSELLEDLIIKTPESDILTIKGVDQLFTGMCAAISVCRKNIAYEDKSLYTDTVLEELKDSDKMSVFDITELGSGKKTEVPKAYVDYDSALKKGYRILDAAAHIWMQNAKLAGDNTIKKISYTPFDEDNYGIFNDSFWYDDLGQSYPDEKNLLQALIKEKSFIKKISKEKKDIKTTGQSIRSTKNAIIDEQAQINGVLNRIMTELFPEKTDGEKTKLIKSTLSFFSGKKEENEANISPKMSEELQAEIIKNFIISQIPDITEEQKVRLNKSAKKITSLISDYNKKDNEIKKLSEYNSTTNKYLYNRNLFKAAAAHRIAIESDLSVSDMLNRYERKYNIPPRNIQIVNYLNSLLQKVKNSPETQSFYNNNGEIYSKDKTEQELIQDIYKVGTIIPQKLNSILNTLYDKDLNSILLEFYNYYIERIESGDEEALYDIKYVLDSKNDKDEIIKLLKQKAKILENNPSYKDTLECVQLLGFQSEFQVLAGLFSSFREEIPEEDYNRLVEKYGSGDNVIDGINVEVKKFNALNKEYVDIINKWNVTPPQVLILNEMEKRNEVLSRRKLDKLKTKFDLTEEKKIRNRQNIPDLKLRKKENEKAYKFSKEEQDILDTIEKSVSHMHRYSKLRYKTLIKSLHNQLEKEYSDIGMLSGQFYVAEEGSSGLQSQNGLRILEQLTGKPYYIEPYLKDAVEVIKEGNSSGVLSMSVDDADYGFHAQYIPQVTTETFTDPITGEKKTEDVIWTDNSWGKTEHENYWNGHNGFYYTDYNDNLGLKEGFIVKPDYTIGIKSDYLNHATGYCKRDNESFSIYRDIHLQGNSAKVNHKNINLLNKIIYMDEYINLYNELEQRILDGEKIDTKEIKGKDDAVTDYCERIIEKVLKIKSKKEFDDLPPDDPVKFAFRKLSLYLAAGSDIDMQNDIAVAGNNNELFEIYQDMISDAIDGLKSHIGKSDAFLEKIFLLSSPDITELLEKLTSKYNIKLSEEDRNKIISDIFLSEDTLNIIDGSLAKTKQFYQTNIINTADKYLKDDKICEEFFNKAAKIVDDNIDEQLKADSVENFIAQNNDAKLLVKAIDKYLKPKSDEEMLEIINGMIQAPDENISSFFDMLSDEEIGLHIRDPYDYVVKVKDYDTSVMNSLRSITGFEYLYDKTSDDDVNATDIYRRLWVKLSDLDIQKYISDYKDEVLRKYSVRSAFPDPTILTEEKLNKVTNEFLEDIKEQTDIIESFKERYQIIQHYLSCDNILADNKSYQALLNKTNVENSFENADEIKQIIDYYAQLSEYSKNDSFLDNVNENINNLITLLKQSQGRIDGRKAFSYINAINIDFEELQAANYKPDFFQNTKKKLEGELKKYIKNTVDTNILKRYRNDAYNILKKLILLYSEGNNIQLIESYEEELRNLFINKNILKNPNDLLDECVDLLQQGKTNSFEYQTKKNYLNQAVETAMQTDIQYKLIKNNHEGISSKIKSLLPIYNVITSTGETQPLDTDLGIVFLMQKLNNLNDDNTTLRLFLNQTGLTSKAFNAFLKYIETNKIHQEVATQTEKAIKSIDEITKVDDIITSFINKNGIRFKTMEEAIDNLKKYSERKLKNENVDDSEIYKTYLSVLNPKNINVNVDNFDPKGISALLQNIRIDILSSLVEFANRHAENILIQGKALQNQAIIIEDLDIPKGGEDEQKYNEFYNQIQEEFNFINNCQILINEKIDNCPFLNAQSGKY